MPTEPIPQSLTVPMESLVSLAIECWRLKGGIGNDSSPPVRHALRRMNDFLQLCEIQTQELTGHPFDAGMAARVIDTLDDPSLPADRAIIEETLVPMVLWRGQVIRPAEIVVRQGKQ